MRHHVVGILIAIVLCVVSHESSAASCANFPDVDAGNAEYCSAVQYLVDKGITLGCAPYLYCPDAPVTRLQMALFVQRMARGGAYNTLGYYTDTIGGGEYNSATTEYSTVGGGFGNNATAYESTVSGGGANQATAQGAAILGGTRNTAGGVDSVVLGGDDNDAEGELAIAAGYYANAPHPQTFVWAGWYDGVGYASEGPNGVWFGSEHGLTVEYGQLSVDKRGTRWVHTGDRHDGSTIATWTGAYLSDGGTWTNSSDRSAKTDIVPVNAQRVLNLVSAMPISTWRYKTETNQIHLGPMAQDFHAAFGLGADERHITTIDEGGVALAAIQALNAKLGAQNAAQARELAEVKVELAAIRNQLSALNR